jgi:hypothetical protein
MEIKHLRKIWNWVELIAIILPFLLLIILGND